MCSEDYSWVASAEETTDNEVKSHFGKANNSWLHGWHGNSTLQLHQAPSVRAQLWSTFSRLASCILRNPSNYLQDLWPWFWEAQDNKIRHEASERWKRAARQTAATVFDTESLNPHASEWIYFCFLQLNLENRFSQNFNYWQNSLADNRWFGMALMSCQHSHCIKSTSHIVEHELHSWANQDFFPLIPNLFSLQSSVYIYHLHIFITYIFILNSLTLFEVNGYFTYPCRYNIGIINIILILI